MRFRFVQADAVLSRSPFSWAQSPAEVRISLFTCVCQVLLYCLLADFFCGMLCIITRFKYVLQRTQTTHAKAREYVSPVAIHVVRLPVIRGNFGRVLLRLLSLNFSVNSLCFSWFRDKSYQNMNSYALQQLNIRSVVTTQGDRRQTALEKAGRSFRPSIYGV